MRRPVVGGVPFFFIVVGFVAAVASTRVDAQDRGRSDNSASPQAEGSAPAPSATAPAPSATPSAGTAAPLQAVYRIDPRKSQLFVEAEKGGVLGFVAHDHRFQVKDFSGTIGGAAMGLQSATLELTIVAASLTLVDKVSEDERKEIETSMRDKVLETAKFPKVLLRSAGVTVGSTNGASQNVTLVTNFWLHGVGHKITIPMTVTLQGDTLHATGSYKMRQTDYGIEPYTAAGGTIRVKDEVTLVFDILATR